MAPCPLNVSDLADVVEKLLASSDALVDVQIELIEKIYKALGVQPEKVSSMLVSLPATDHNSFPQYLSGVVSDGRGRIRELAIDLVRDLLLVSPDLESHWSKEFVKGNMTTTIWSCLSDVDTVHLSLCFEVLEIFARNDGVSNKVDRLKDLTLNYFTYYCDKFQWDLSSTEMQRGIRYVHRLAKNSFGDFQQDENPRKLCAFTTRVLVINIGRLLESADIDKLLELDQMVPNCLDVCIWAVKMMEWHEVDEGCATEMLVGWPEEDLPNRPATVTDGKYSLVGVLKKILGDGKNLRRRVFAMKVMRDTTAQLLPLLDKLSDSMMTVVLQFCLRVALLLPPNNIRHLDSVVQRPEPTVGQMESSKLMSAVVTVAKIFSINDPDNPFVVIRSPIFQRPVINPSDRLQQMLSACSHVVKPDANSAVRWEIDLAELKDLLWDQREDTGITMVFLSVISSAFERQLVGQQQAMAIRTRDVTDEQWASMMSVLARLLFVHYKDPLAGAIALEAVMRVLIYLRMNNMEMFTQCALDSASVLNTIMKEITDGTYQKLFECLKYFTGGPFLQIVAQLVIKLGDECPFGIALIKSLSEVDKKPAEPYIGSTKLWVAIEYFLRGKG